MRTALTILAAAAWLQVGCSEKGSAPQQTLSITDSRTGHVGVVKRDDYFKVTGNPPAVTVLPLRPEVTGAILSQYDSFVAKAMEDRDRNPNASLLLMSLHESMSAEIWKALPKEYSPMSSLARRSYEVRGHAAEHQQAADGAARRR